MRLSEIGIRVLVEDFKACFDFYTEKLGLHVNWGHRDGTFASFSAPGDDKPCFSMFMVKHQGMYKGYAAPVGTGRKDQAVYVIPTDDVDGDYRTLGERGVVFMGEPQTIKEWYMRCVYFRDPEGNLFELCQDGADAGEAPCS